MKVVRVRTDKQAIIAVAGNPGRKFTHYVAVNSFPIRLRKMKNADFGRYSKDVDLPLKTTCRKMLSAGRRMGITKGARKLLREGKA